MLENVSEIKRISRLNSKQPVNKSKKSKSKQLVVKVQKKCAVITSLIEKNVACESIMQCVTHI